MSLSSNQDPTTFAPFADGNRADERVVTELNWRRRLTDPIGITYTPFAQLRGDLYQLDNYIDPQAINEPTENTSLARGLAAGWRDRSPIRGWQIRSSGSHVIEPIGQIIARQAHIDQNSLPNEDAQSLVFDDTNLFEVTKFSGYDRIEIGTRANVGLQYTFQSNDGGYARILAGESLPSRRRRTLTQIPAETRTAIRRSSPFSGLQNDRSDYVLGAYFAPWSFIAVDFAVALRSVRASTSAPSGCRRPR